LTLPDRGFRHLERGFLLADLLADLAILDLGDRLAPADRIAKLDVHGFEPSVDAGHGLDGGGPDEVADDRHAFDDVAALDRREFDRHRRTGPTAAATARAAALRLTPAACRGREG